ncbi:sulfatase-like hydrolase/transferase [Oceanicoccus sagamiensis]|uniref:Sulfatase N-terminal domain-containing protein n=1 Tax=Oceanicoccus sagamiensis TaxID=716816 RepID=A0A1X9NIQ0_9GAMM|nr:sulfatase-like hydrolase/transferase [Oceanicoccus sagamiensis]ARN73863.1 hypothetical protein BST96_06885 [Oceanicoccus sagamiensis]
MKSLFNDYWMFAALIGFSIWQPLLDVFSRSIEFFVAWRLSGYEIFALVFVSYFIVPAFFVALLCLTKKLNKGFGGFIEFVLVFVFSCLIFLVSLPNADVLALELKILCCLAFSAITVFFYVKKTVFKQFLTYAGLLSILFPAMFFVSLYMGDFFKSTNDAKSVVSELKGPSNHPPVVLIVLDELSLISLLDGKGRLDKVRYPNIGRFAKDGVWYINAQSAGVHTTESVPALLSSTLKHELTLPNIANYPDNLFTLLSADFELYVSETGTQLCPESDCQDDLVPFNRKIKGVAFDFGLTYLHLVLPERIKAKLPSINHQLNDFGAFMTLDGRDVIGQRLNKHGDFIEKVRSRKGVATPFFYSHLLLPHYPWVLLPSGKQHTKKFKIEGLINEKWTGDSWQVTQGYQQHLLQTVFVDTLFGEIVSTLKEEGLYENSLIILTSDHGVGFSPGGYRRLSRKVYESLNSPVAKENFLSVPLIIKYPHSNKGEISYREASTLDILPTIADVVGKEIPFDVQGVSLLRPLKAKAENNMFPFVDSLPLKKKIALFGEGDIGNIFKVGDRFDVIGKKLTGSEKDSDLTGKVVISNLPDFNRVDKSSDFIPAKIEGQVLVEQDRRLFLALAVNDIVCAVSRVKLKLGEVANFSFLTQENCFIDGNNTLKVLEIINEKSPLQMVFDSRTTEEAARVQRSIFLKDGSVLRESREMLDGRVDHVSYDEEKGSLVVWGWAADIVSGETADYVLYRVGKKLFFGSQVDGERSGLAKHYKKDGLRYAGYGFSIPSHLVAGKEFEILWVSKEGKYGPLSLHKFNNISLDIEQKLSDKELPDVDEFGVMQQGFY